MNSKSKTLLLSAVAFTALQVSSVLAQPAAERYKAPSNLPSSVAQITVYQPGVGTEIGSLKVNDRYHASLHGGSYTKLCFARAGSVAISGRILPPSGLATTQEGDKIVVPLVLGKEVIVRMMGTAAGRTALEIVSPEVAKVALQSADLQIHTLSRVPDLVSCDSVTEKLETITLASDVVFDFNKSDVASVSAAGRASLDSLIERMVKQYGSFEKAEIEVIGYADPVGPEANNMSLTKLRARNIKKYMVAKGIAANKIKVESRGATELMVSNCAPSATPQNIVCNVSNRHVMVRASVPVSINER
jgi:outer membrane protein OmpA-like peptidoglycan-associated protein